MEQNGIHIVGARQHNLKNVTLTIPHNQLVVVCGPSGSGKSTLAFDIVYAEGQRRYVESLSTYARQFLPQMDKPLVDKIEGLSPAISLEQQTTSRNPRSTVGTVTEIYDFLRVFYARLATMHCPCCGNPIEASSPDEIIARILEHDEKTRCILLAPLVEHQKGTHAERLRKLKGEGFMRVRINGEFFEIDQAPILDKNKKHTLELVVDRIVIREGIRTRLADSLELALKHGNGRVVALSQAPDSSEEWRETVYSVDAVCPACKISMPPLTPQLFSFNSPQGACPSCYGIGSIEYFEPSLIAPNTGLSLATGALLPWKNPRVLEKYAPSLKKLGNKWGFSLSTPLAEFSPAAWQCLFYGENPAESSNADVAGPKAVVSSSGHVRYGFRKQLGRDAHEAWPGVIPILEQGMEFGDAWHDYLSRYRQSACCPACGGSRLNPEALSAKVDGLNIQDFCSLSIEKAARWLEERKFSPRQKIVAEPLLKELRHRLDFMVNVGLDYLSLDRSMATLSGGEAQRIRLASQLGSGLVGVTYVLDEPSIGLHPRDNKRLIATLRNLQRRGNTVLVVEHDEAMIREADTIVEMGPGSGEKGGEVVFTGPVKQLLGASHSLTAQYLRNELSLFRQGERRQPTDWIRLKNITTNNLKGLDVSFPLGVFTCVTGVSGSGKSSLVMDTLYKHIALHQGLKAENPGKIGGMEGLERIERVMAIDQTPIGRTPRSNPATYTKIFDEIRAIFAMTPDAKKRGYQPGRFSFNVRGGRCEACGGDGQIKVEMHFLPDVYVTCDVCKGRRYNHETLEVRYKGLTIADVLNMTVEEAYAFFENYPVLERRLKVLKEVGLDYIRLGQPATTLSGGEAQRIKISRELGKKSLPGTLYILDEPTTGLHMHEVGKLIQVLNQLVEKGASVVVIEHNTDVMMSADYIIDLGPGGGENGGRVVASGTPENIAEEPQSATGEFIRQGISGGKNWLHHGDT